MKNIIKTMPLVLNCLSEFFSLSLSLSLSFSWTLEKLNLFSCSKDERNREKVFTFKNDNERYSIKLK